MFHDSNSHVTPLAEIMRPRSGDDLVGQEIWSEHSTLKKLVAQDRAYNLIFWGPPGTGKTSLAHIVARESGHEILAISAVHASVKDLRDAFAKSDQQIARGQKSLLIFVDEIHRLSKSQQDVLLPELERGKIRFIGATTENPSFSVNSAVLSRCLVFHFKPLSNDSLVVLMKKALESPSVEFAADTTHPPFEATAESLALLAESAAGDARRALTVLSAAMTLASQASGGNNKITRDTVDALAKSLPLRYDRQGEQHFDTISAFIKSIRASHPDAAVYYLARMIESGEDPLFIARRLLIAASEDIGNANPMALSIASSTFQAVQVLGLPEARIPLSQCTVYLASSPKSNRAYVAINKALDDCKKLGALEIPMHLRNPVTELMRQGGYGKGYKYAHDHAAESRKMAYLPKELSGTKYYEPLLTGVEKQLLENLRHLRPTED